MANLSFFETCQSIVIDLQARACHVSPALEDAYPYQPTRQIPFLL
jgi:hypothetical protein